ncbi:alpha/beta hydrolase [Haloarculaceae archaeon H-GB11]|nr:alpha/beta hydrolase [Haloarculaceae archaeon H-GB11]
MGNRLDHETVRWLLDAFARDYRVHAFQLPLVITDFDADYLTPIASHAAGLDEYRVLGHSTGGLVAAFLDGAETTTYLSPWWGFHRSLRKPLVYLLMRLPVSWPILPSNVTREGLGDMATTQQVADAPDYAAPTFLWECHCKQESLPPLDEDSVVFYTPEDSIVSVEDIREHAPPANRVEYDGGHELFSSSVREDALGTLRDAVAGGVDAVSD